MAKDKSYLICRCNQFFALGPFSPNHSCSLNAISGRKGGRKPKMTDSKIESAKKLLASGVPPKDVAKNYNTPQKLDQKIVVNKIE